MKAFLIGVTVIGMARALLGLAAAQEIDPQCGNMRDKIACTCALQNGGRLTRSPAPKKKAWWMRGQEVKEPGDIPDRERITFPAKFKFKNWKLRPSPQVEGYLACMHRHGRK
jgi:hypothetical protein